MADGTLSTEVRLIPDAWMVIQGLEDGTSHRDMADLVRQCCARTDRILASIKEWAPGRSRRRVKKVIRRALTCESFRIGTFRRALKAKAFEVGVCGAGYDECTTSVSLRRVIEIGKVLSVFDKPSAGVMVMQTEKADGDTREVFVFSVQEHARHLMMSQLWRAVEPCPPRQFGSAGGIPKLQKFLAERLATATRVATTDFHECYFSLAHNQVKAGCPLPWAAMRLRLTDPLTRGQQIEVYEAQKVRRSDERNNPEADNDPGYPDWRDDPQGRHHISRSKSGRSLIPLALWAGLCRPANAAEFRKGWGVPMGSPLSVLAAEKVLSAIVDRVEAVLPGATCALVADNLLILLTSKTSEDQIKSALSDAARSAIGDLHLEELLQRLSLSDPKAGFIFCKRHYSLSGQRLEVRSRPGHFSDLQTRIINEYGHEDAKFSTALIPNRVLTHSTFFTGRREHLAAMRTAFELGQAIGDAAETPPTVAAKEQLAFERAPLVIYIATSCEGFDSPGAWAATVASASGVNTYSGGEDFTSIQRLQLKALIVALTAVPEGTHVRVMATSGFLAATLDDVGRWHAQAFRRADGRRLMNQSLWRNIHELTQTRHVKAYAASRRRTPRKLVEAQARADELLHAMSS